MVKILTPTGWKDVLDEGRKCHLFVNGKHHASFPNMEAAEREQEKVLQRNPKASTFIDTNKLKKPEPTKFSPPGRWINEETEEEKKFDAESDAWHAGMAHQPGDKNPHKRGTNLYHAWNRGKIEAKKQDKASSARLTAAEKAAERRYLNYLEKKNMKEEVISFDEMTDEEILGESRDKLTKQEVNQYLRREGYNPHPNPGRYTHHHSRWGSVKVSNMLGGLHIYGRKIDSFSDPEAVRRHLKKPLKEEFYFDEMTDEEILDLLEEFSDETLDFLLENINDNVNRQRVVSVVTRSGRKISFGYTPPNKARKRRRVPPPQGPLTDAMKREAARWIEKPEHGSN